MSELLPNYDAWKLQYPPEYDEEECGEYYMPGDDPKLNPNHFNKEPDDERGN